MASGGVHSNNVKKATNILLRCNPLAVSLASVWTLQMLSIKQEKQQIPFLN